MCCHRRHHQRFVVFFYSSYGLFSGELGTCFLPPCNCKYLFIRREREACVSVTMNQECSEICTWLFFVSLSNVKYFPSRFNLPFLEESQWQHFLPSLPPPWTGTSCLAQRAICQCLCMRRSLLPRQHKAPLTVVCSSFASSSCCFLLRLTQGGAAAWDTLRNSNVQRQPEVGDERRCRCTYAGSSGARCQLWLWLSRPPARPVCGKTCAPANDKQEKTLKLVVRREPDQRQQAAFGIL